MIHVTSHCILSLALICMPTLAIVHEQGSALPEQVREDLPDGGWVQREVLRSENGELLGEGKFQRFDAQGQERVTGQYDLGKATGAWRWRSAGGTNLAKGVFRDGDRHGAWTFYWPDGEKRARGKYRGNKKLTDWTYFDEQGDQDSERSGERVHISGSFGFGGTSYAGHLLRGRLDGGWRFYWPNGQEMLEAEFESGRRVGKWRFKHADGSRDAAFFAGAYGGGGFDGWMDFEPRPESVLSKAGPRRAIAKGAAGHTTDLDMSAFVEHLASSKELSAIARTIDLFLQGNAAQRQVSRRSLLAEGRAVVSPCLRVLLATDLGDSRSTGAAARLVAEVLQPATQKSFGWTAEIGAAAEQSNRQALLRWISFHWLTFNNPLYWDLEVRWTRDREQVQPILIEAMVARADALSDEPMLVSGSARTDKTPVSLRAAGGSGTEGPLRDGLAWLVAHQSPQGNWSSSRFESCCKAVDKNTEECPDPGAEDLDTGVTALAALALLRNGNTAEQGVYAHELRRALGYLMSKTSPDTGRIGQRRTQWHIMEQALAVSAFSEALLTSSSPGLREAAQNATNYMSRSRDPYLGWRYDAPSNGDNDSAVTGLALQALVAAREAGLKIDPAALEGGLKWFQYATESSNGRIGYSDTGSLDARYDRNDHYPREKGEAMTAMGLWVQLLMGRDPDDHPVLTKSAGLLLRTLPEWDPEGYGCNMFYWTFGSYAMYAMGGSNYWKHWNKAMKIAVLDSQRRDAHTKGSWDPVGPWGVFGGRVYATAMMCLTLEVYGSRRKF